MLGSDDDDSGGIDDMIDLVEKATELYRDNEDKINEMVGKEGNRMVIEEQESLKTYNVTEEEITVTIETTLAGESQMGLEYDADNNNLIVKSGGDDEYIIDLKQNDVDISSIDYEINNGVLNITIPRGDENGNH